MSIDSCLSISDSVSIGVPSCHWRLPNVLLIVWLLNLTTHFRPPPRLTLIRSDYQAYSMERKLINQKGSSVTISPCKSPGEYMMSFRYPDGGMHIIFIKDVEAKVKMLLGEGYVEVKE